MVNIYSKDVAIEFQHGVVDECRDNGCQLKLSGFPRERVIVKVDDARSSGESGRRCDHIIVVDDNNEVFLIPVEFKSVTLSPDKIKEQLEGGLKFFCSHMPNQFNCFPILVSKKIDTYTRKQLLKFPVNYKGKNIRIKHVICNKTLFWREVKKAI